MLKMRPREFTIERPPVVYVNPHQTHPKTKKIDVSQQPNLSLEDGEINSVLKEMSRELKV